MPIKTRDQIDKEIAQQMRTSFLQPLSFYSSSQNAEEQRKEEEKKHYLLELGQILNAAHTPDQLNELFNNALIHPAHSLPQFINSLKFFMNGPNAIKKEDPRYKALLEKLGESLDLSDVKNKEQLFNKYPEFRQAISEGLSDMLPERVMNLYRTEPGKELPEKPKDSLVDAIANRSVNSTPPKPIESAAETLKKIYGDTAPAAPSAASTIAPSNPNRFTTSYAGRQPSTGDRNERQRWKSAEDNLNSMYYRNVIDRETRDNLLARIPGNSSGHGISPVINEKYLKAIERDLESTYSKSDNRDFIRSLIRSHPTEGQSPQSLTTDRLKQHEAELGSRPFRVPADDESTATGATTNIIRQAARNPEAYLEERRRLENQRAEALNAGATGGFKIAPPPPAVKGEDFNATGRQWVAEEMLRLASAEPEARNFSAPEHPLSILGRQKLQKAAESFEHRSEEDKALSDFQKRTMSEGHLPSVGEKMTMDATAPITPEELKKYEGPYYEQLMNRIESRAKNRFDEAKQDRLKSFERNLGGRFQGNAWNSGARREYERDFNDLERRHERDYMEQMKDAEIQLLHQGNFEAWGRAMANRDRMSRGASQVNNMTNERLSRVNQAARDNAILSQSRRQHQLGAAHMLSDIGRTAWGDDQNRMDRENIEHQRQMNAPAQRLMNVHSVLNNHPVLPPQVVPPVPIPQPQRSGFTQAGAALGAYNSMLQQNQNAELQNQLLRAQTKAFGG